MSNGDASDLGRLRSILRTFAKERDWEQFHNPKNLSMALSVEAGEILEHFQWLTADEAANLSPERREAVAEELADVLIFLVRLADVLQIDLAEAAARKVEKNAVRYPIARVRGKALKYSEYE
jgi:dCTP diphosphatase